MLEALQSGLGSDGDIVNLFRELTEIIDGMSFVPHSCLFHTSVSWVDVDLGFGIALTRDRGLRRNSGSYHFNFPRGNHKRPNRICQLGLLDSRTNTPIPR